MSAPALEMRDVHRAYPTRAGAVTALGGVTLTLDRGGFTAVMGPSGSGKSTFLHCAAGLDRPHQGEVRVGGQSLAGMSETQLTRLRRDRIGFVFQSYNLLPALDAADNITFPLRLARRPLDRGWIRTVVARVGVDHLLGRRPAELSGGQQQRVAIARALATRPDLILADEPTGALDSETAGDVLTLLAECSGDLGQTVLMVTHDPVAASYADRVVFLRDGLIASILNGPTPAVVADRMTTVAGRQ